MCQDFQKTLVESITLRVEPEPSTSTSTESHGSSPPWVLKTQQNDDGRWHGTNHGEGQGCPTNHRGILSYAYFLACFDLQIHS